MIRRRKKTGKSKERNLPSCMNGENKQARTFFLITSIITAFVFAVSFGTMYVSTQLQENNNNACSCSLDIVTTIILLSSLGLFVGTLVAYFMLGSFATEKKTTKNNISLTLRFLESEDRKIIKYLIEKEEANQSEIAKATMLSKVKVSRRLKELESKKIIEKQTNGLTNSIKLKKEFRDLFC